jgi:hypothetical protein
MDHGNQFVQSSLATEESRPKSQMERPRSIRSSAYGTYNVEKSLRGGKQEHTKKQVVGRARIGNSLQM